MGGGWIEKRGERSVGYGFTEMQFLRKPDLHGMTECRMAEWQDGGMAEWWNGGRNGGMAEWQCTVKTNVRRKSPDVSRLPRIVGECVHNLGNGRMLKVPYTRMDFT